MERAVDWVDESVWDIYKVDILTAILWMKQAWNRLPSSMVRKRWDHTSIVIS